MQPRVFLKGFTKNAKFMFSTPQKVQKALFISETGLITMEILPMSTGFINSDLSKRAWVVLHSLKMRICKDGEPVDDEPVLVISERSYKPIDPNNRIKPRDKEKLTSLTDIARLRHADARSETATPNNQNDIAHTAIVAYSIIIGLCILYKFIFAMWGNQ
jgi:hypothetical protein